MPAVSKAQQGFMGADLARAKQGKPTKTGMSTAKLTDFASISPKGLPARKGPAKRGRKLGSANYSSKSKAAMHGRFKVT